MERVEKQTAVEWLVEMLVQECGLDDTGDSAIFVIEQAKAIEKENIKNAFLDGFSSLANNKHQYSEDYYNETFKSE
jgi:hypothetical protein